MTKKELIARLRNAASSPPERHTLDPLAGQVRMCTWLVEEYVAPARWRAAERAVRAASPELVPGSEAFTEALAEQFARLRAIELQEGPFFPLIAAPLVDKNRAEPPLSEDEASFFISRTIKARTLLFRSNIAALITAIRKGK